MKFLNIFEKINVVFDLIINSNTLILIILFIVATFILRLSNRISNKKMFLMISFIEMIAFMTVFYFESSNLIQIGTEIIDSIFLNFYFPSINIYLFIFAFNIILFGYVFLNRNISKIYKKILKIYILIFNFIFIMFVSIIVNNNINIFVKESLFTNQEALVLLELSTLLFFLYLMINMIIYVTNCIIMYVSDKGFGYNKNKSFENYDDKINNVEIEVELPQKVEEELKPSYSFNDITLEVVNSKFAKEEKTINISKKIDLVPEFTKIIEQKNKPTNEIISKTNSKDDFTFVDPTLLINTNNRKNYYGTDIAQKMNFIDFNMINETIDKDITLNDYKMFSKMLKTVIESNKKSVVGMNDILNEKLLSKCSLEEYNKFEKILNSCMN